MLSNIVIANVLTVVLAANSTTVLAAGKSLNVIHAPAIAEAKVLMKKAIEELKSKKVKIKRFTEWFGEPASQSRITSAESTFGSMLGNVDRVVLRDHRLDRRGPKCNTTDQSAEHFNENFG